MTLSLNLEIYVLLGGEAATTTTFQLGCTGSTLDRDIFTKNPEKNLEKKTLRMCISEVCSD